MLHYNMLKRYIRLNQLEASLMSTVIKDEKEVSAIKSFIDECLVNDWSKKPWCSWFNEIDYDTISVIAEKEVRDKCIAISDAYNRTILILSEESSQDVLHYYKISSKFLIVYIGNGTGSGDNEVDVYHLSADNLLGWYDKYFPKERLFNILLPWAEHWDAYDRIKNSSYKIDEWARCTQNLVESRFIDDVIKEGEQEKEKYRLIWNRKPQSLVYWCYKVLNECKVWDNTNVKGNFELFDEVFKTKKGLLTGKDLYQEYDRITDSKLRKDGKDNMWKVGQWAAEKREIDGNINLNRY